jgi:hypothetical protein
VVFLGLPRRVSACCIGAGQSKYSFLYSDAQARHALHPNHNSSSLPSLPVVVQVGIAAHLDHTFKKYHSDNKGYLNVSYKGQADNYVDGVGHFHWMPCRRCPFLLINSCIFYWMPCRRCPFLLINSSILSLQLLQFPLQGTAIIKIL